MYSAHRSKTIYSILCLLFSWFFVLILVPGCGGGGSTASTAGTTNTPSSTTPAVVGNSVGAGSILYSYGGVFFLINGAAGSAPVNLDTRFTSAGAGTGVEDKMGISRDGKYLAVSTTRLGCGAWACLARFNVDGTGGEKVTVGAGGADLHVYATQPVISPTGSTIIFTQQNSDNSIDLFATTRAGGVWSALTNITASSAYTYNTDATISADGAKVAFVCSNSIAEDPNNNICEVNIDGTGYQALIVAGSSNNFTNVFRPSYANNGDLNYEGIFPTGTATTGGERIWRLKAARTAAAAPAGDFANAVSPCSMPNGNLAVLWLGRSGGTGLHELTLINSNDVFDSTLFGGDVDDIGISCSE